VIGYTNQPHGNALLDVEKLLKNVLPALGSKPTKRGLKVHINCVAMKTLLNDSYNVHYNSFRTLRHWNGPWEVMSTLQRHFVVPTGMFSRC
jgi:hypothetical protein